MRRCRLLSDTQIGKGIVQHLGLLLLHRYHHGRGRLVGHRYHWHLSCVPVGIHGGILHRKKRVGYRHTVVARRRHVHHGHLRESSLRGMHILQRKLRLRGHQHHHAMSRSTGSTLRQSGHGIQLSQCQGVRLREHHGRRSVQAFPARAFARLALATVAEAGAVVVEAVVLVAAAAGVGALKRKGARTTGQGLHDSSDPCATGAAVLHRILTINADAGCITNLTGLETITIELQTGRSTTLAPELDEGLRSLLLFHNSWSENSTGTCSRRCSSRVGGSGHGHNGSTSSRRTLGAGRYDCRSSWSRSWSQMRSQSWSGTGRSWSR
mmetsp:Transcript_23108/g.50157  ORF Transcript_23108/g.50157 Transcript_23108/m.50157 type:complete len:323 (-) Transcript_23108:823-1791(-)